MIPPLFTQHNEDPGNRLNAGHPSEDFDTYGEGITKSIAGVVGAYGTAEDPTAYASNFAHRIFPNMLPYEVSTPAVFGFAEWNGRSLIDNAPDVMFTSARIRPYVSASARNRSRQNPPIRFPMFRLRHEVASKAAVPRPLGDFALLNGAALRICDNHHGFKNGIRVQAD